MNFKAFKHPVAQQFERMLHYPLFRVDVDKDLLWQTYLDAFPPGSDPVFRKRRGHDCSCCKQFIRAVGDVVAVVNGYEVVSLWDVLVEGEPDYQAVARALNALVHSKPISNIFVHTEPRAGTDRSLDQMLENNVVVEWQHFFVNIPRDFVVKGADVGPKLSEARALHDVLARGLTELTDDALDTTLELIAQNSLYRGEENRAALETFRDLKRKYDLVSAEAADAFVWLHSQRVPASVARLRNTAIGTLLIDLSAGMEMEDAVRKFEVVVAPTNYKRPTALVTKKMVEQARTRIEELGLTSALERRYARLDDVSVNDVLFVDRSARTRADVFDELPTAASKRTLDRVEEVPVEKFIREVLPRAASVELLVENRHAGNFVSLIAPANPTSLNLFKWNNKFSWTYAGDVADSIRERVKKAGGNVTGEVLCRLAWHNYDDLDLHMKEPGGYEIYFANKLSISPSGGRLDVDMNAGAGHTREPVENIYYAQRATMREGTYTLFVHIFCKRESVDEGFEVEFDYLGETQHFAYARSVRTHECIPVVTFDYTHKDGVRVRTSLPSTTASKTVWGVRTHEFVRVDAIMLSPNYWSGQGVGNKHYFFMLAGCRNDGQARGFYNEFLTDALLAHRKVIELVGARMRTEESAHQLSGLGFASTQRNHVLARVRGAFTRTVKIVF